MQKLVILGSEDALETAIFVAERAVTPFSVSTLELSTDDGFNFLTPDMSPFPTAEWQAFVAIDKRALNLPRLRMVGQLKSVGYRLARIVSKDATLAETAVVGENTILHSSSHIGERCSVGLNVIVCSGANVSSDAKIGASNYIGPRAMIEQGVVTGDLVTVGADVVIAEGAMIGKYCELAHKRTYCGAVPASTFYIPGFENPIKIVNPY